jgi:hypothetical protein
MYLRIIVWITPSNTHIKNKSFPKSTKQKIPQTVQMVAARQILETTSAFTLEVLHYAALPSDKKIDEGHVHQILGIGNHSEKTVKQLLQKLKNRKKT